MPPLVFAVLCWIVGAFLGSADQLAMLSLPTIIAIAVLGAASVGRLGQRVSGQTSWHYLACALAVAAGLSVVLARTSRERQRACQQALVHALNSGDRARAVFDDHVAPRTSSRGVLVGIGALEPCSVPVSMRVVNVPAPAGQWPTGQWPTGQWSAGQWSAGQWPAGQWMVARGSATVAGRGIRVEGTIDVASPQATDWLRRIRARTGDIIDRDFGAHAPLVRALLIADQDGIAPAVRDTFASAGLVHLLSVSGLHVAIIAGALMTLAGALRLSRSAAFVLSIFVIIVYVMVLGAPAPAVRSAVMLGVVGLSEQWQRPVHPWTALALGAVLPTVQPAVVLDLGYQLSVSGMASLVAARALLRHTRQMELLRCPPRARMVLRWFKQLRGWRYTLLRESVTGTIATLVTAPLIAWTFGRLSLVAPLSNLVAGPLVAFAQPALFLSLVCSPWPTLSRWIADASAVPLDVLDMVANVFASMPLAAVSVAPTALGACCASVAAAAFVWASGSRRWMPGLLTGVAALTLAIWSPALQRGSGQFELHVLDVGQGDALALRTPHGKWILVDSGRRWDGGDAGRRTVIPYIRALGGPVAAFIMTHAHDDHVGGAASIVTALHPVEWWEPAFVTTSAAYRNALVALKAQGGQWHRAVPSDRWTLDGVSIQVLAPDSAWTANQTDANETSVVLRVQYGNIVFLLTGDAEAAEEQWILAHTDPERLRADVLKLGHHGSKTSSTPAFLNAVAPRLGLASVGTGNRYGHPSPEILERFVDLGIPILRTDHEGTIVVATNGTTIEVRVRRERWRVP